MKKFTTTFFLLLAMVLLLPIEMKAWTSVTFVSADGSLNGKTLVRKSANKFTYELDLSGRTADLSFKFKVSDADCGEIGWYEAKDNEGQNITDFSGSTSYWCANRSDQKMFVLKHSTSSYKKYVLTLEWKNQGDDGKQYWALNVKGVEETGKYYLVVPNENVGNTPRAISDKDWLPKGHKAFEMTAGRERNQSKLNNDLTSVTLKIDGNKGRQLRYDSEGKIKFYIYDETNAQFYQPDGNDYKAAEKEKGTLDRAFDYVDGKNVELIPRYRTSNGRDAIGRSHDNIKNSATGRYYYIKKGSAKYNLDGVDYPTMSLTFMFSKFNGPKTYTNDNGSTGKFDNGNCVYYVNNKKRTLGNAKLLVAFLKTRAYNPGAKTSAKYYDEHIKGNGVYLVGNMGGNGYMNGSEKGYDKDKYSMKPDYWLNGVINNNIKPEEADSIVYSVEINRGKDASNWDEFFLSFTTGDMLGKSDMWIPLLRPRVQNQMDAQALEGGIFYYLTKKRQ